MLELIQTSNAIWRQLTPGWLVSATASYLNSELNFLRLNLLTSLAKQRALSLHYVHAIYSARHFDQPVCGSRTRSEICC